MSGNTDHQPNERLAWIEKIVELRGVLDEFNDSFKMYSPEWVDSLLFLPQFGLENDFVKGLDSLNRMLRIRLALAEQGPSDQRSAYLAEFLRNLEDTIEGQKRILDIKVQGIRNVVRFPLFS